ncbi:unnamed protein product [Choristocarpus tenellus]
MWSLRIESQETFLNPQCERRVEKRREGPSLSMAVRFIVSNRKELKRAIHSQKKLLGSRRSNSVKATIMGLQEDNIELISGQAGEYLPADGAPKWRCCEPGHQGASVQ